MKITTSLNSNELSLVNLGLSTTGHSMNKYLSIASMLGLNAPMKMKFKSSIHAALNTCRRAKNQIPIGFMKTRMRNLLVLSTLTVAFLAASSAQAQFTKVDISSKVNVDIKTYTYGHNYQLGGTQLNVNGVPFALAELNSNPNTTGVVQGGGQSQIGQFNYTFSVPAGTYATVLYTLLNSTYGVLGADAGSIVVTGTGGETATLNLIEGYNIRDHNNNNCVNTLSDTTVVPTYFLNGAPTTQSIQTRLDCQELELPESFSGDTIASITFEGDATIPNGAAFPRRIDAGKCSRALYLGPAGCRPVWDNPLASASALIHKSIPKWIEQQNSTGHRNWWSL